MCLHRPGNSLPLSRLLHHHVDAISSQRERFLKDTPFSCIRQMNDDRVLGRQAVEMCERTLGDRYLDTIAYRSHLTKMMNPEAKRHE